jgi:hypothetical protein
VISIDCDEVLGGIVPRGLRSYDDGGGRHVSVDEDGEEDEIERRDVVDLSGTTDSGTCLTFPSFHEPSRANCLFVFY